MILNDDEMCHFRALKGLIAPKNDYFYFGFLSIFTEIKHKGIFDRNKHF